MQVGTLGWGRTKVIPSLVHHRGRPRPTDVTSGFQLLVPNLMLLEAPMATSAHRHVGAVRDRQAWGVLAGFLWGAEGAAL